MAMVLGSAGQDLVKQFAAQAAGGPGRNAFWGEVVAGSMPKAVFAQLSDLIQRHFVKRFAVTQGSSAIGRAIPFGIGAVIGGAGNHLLGRSIVKASRDAFGPPPAAFPLELEPGDPRAQAAEGAEDPQGDPGRRSRSPRSAIAGGTSSRAKSPEGIESSSSSSESNGSDSLESRSPAWIAA